MLSCIVQIAVIFFVDWREHFCPLLTLASKTERAAAPYPSHCSSVPACHSEKLPITLTLVFVFVCQYIFKTFQDICYSSGALVYASNVSSRLFKQYLSHVKPVDQYPITCSLLRFTVAEWLTHSPATLEVTGSCPTFVGISEICFSNRYGLQHRATLNGLCGSAGIFCDLQCRAVSGDIWLKLTVVPRWAALVNTRQAVHTHTHTHCAHNSW